MLKFGLNVHSLTALDTIQRLKPAVAMVFASSWGQNLDWLSTLKTVSPDTILAYRSWSWHSGGDLDHFDWYEHGTNAQPFIDDVSRLQDRLSFPVYWHTFNETGHDSLPEYFEWHLNAVHLANQRGLKLVTLNFGVGHPTGTPDEVQGAWMLGYEFFKELGDSVVGLHEYFPGAWDVDRGWLVGRYKKMFAVCDTIGVPRPKVLFTEYGTDKAFYNGGHPVLQQYCPELASGGWASMAACGFWQKYRQIEDQQLGLAHEIIDSHASVYDYDPSVLGTCYFSWGAVSPAWEQYDISKANRTLELLIKAKETSMDDKCKSALEQARLSVSPQPKYLVKETMKIRSAPVVDICSDTGSRMEAGSLVSAITEVAYGGYHWVEFEPNRFIAKASGAGDAVYLERLDEEHYFGVRSVIDELKPLMVELGNLPGMDYFEE